MSQANLICTITSSNNNHKSEREDWHKYKKPSVPSFNFTCWNREVSDKGEWNINN